MGANLPFEIDEIAQCYAQNSGYHDGSEIERHMCPEQGHHTGTVTDDGEHIGYIAMLAQVEMSHLLACEQMIEIDIDNRKNNGETANHQHHVQSEPKRQNADVCEKEKQTVANKGNHKWGKDSRKNLCCHIKCFRGCGCLLYLGGFNCFVHGYYILLNLAIGILSCKRYLATVLRAIG